MTFSPAAHKENRVPTKLLVGSSLSMREFFRHSRSSFLFLEDDAVDIRSLELGYPIVFVLLASDAAGVSVNILFCMSREYMCD